MKSARVQTAKRERETHTQSNIKVTPAQKVQRDGEKDAKGVRGVIEGWEWTKLSSY